ncbi:MAG: TolC family protein [Planctomycetaceae bacterium]|nr:TolC family protein [Planctomycetaceae bacterium]
MPKMAARSNQPQMSVVADPGNYDECELGADHLIEQVAAKESSPQLPPVVSPVPSAHHAVRLTVFQAIETALVQNPDLVTQRQAEGVSAAALGVAQTYPFNPSVQIQATPFQDFPGGGPGTTHHYVLLMQQIQLAHQQDFREQGAGAQLNSVRWNILQAQLLTVAQTERLYFTALYLQGLRDLSQATATNNQQLLTILEKQLDAGQATAADVAMVRLDARSTQQQLRLAEANYQTALLDLRRQLGLPRSMPVELTTNLIAWGTAVIDDGFAVVHDETSMAALAAGRPDVLAARADIDAARANVCLADASRTPDVQLGPYYQRTLDGSTFLGFRMHMDLPVINDGRPLLRQREAELHQRTMAWQQLQTRAELEAQAALERYQRARGLLSELEADASQDLPHELQRLEEQFRAGEVDVLRIFQARTSVIQHRRAVLDSLNELTQAAVAVTAATGLPVEGLLTVSAQQMPPQSH